jgi:phosphate transport system permease protein
MFLAAASCVLTTLGVLGVLVSQSLGFFKNVGLIEFLTGREWTPLFDKARFGVLPLLLGTLRTSAVALLVAIPVGTILAMWLSEYAPRRVREFVKPILELLSAVPTVVFGYFALTVITPVLQRSLGKVGYEVNGFNSLSAGLVMGIMIVPYVASLSEDVMRSVPNALREGALGMGATRFQTCRKVIFPAALSGIISAYVLAMSRALGETMIVAIAGGNQPMTSLNPLDPAQTMTAYIVSVAMGDVPHGSVGYNSIYAVGLLLAIITLFFNLLGYWFRKKYREAY